MPDSIPETTDKVTEPRRSPRGSYSAKAVLKSAGITYRQFDHWCRRGWVTDVRDTSGPGNWRRFTREQIIQVTRLAELTRAGLATPVAVSALHTARDLGSGGYTVQIGPRIIVHVLPEPASLVTSGGGE